MERSYIVVMVTASSREEAESIVRGLLDERLVACGNIVGPVSSIFCWTDKIEQAEEYLILEVSLRLV